MPDGFSPPRLTVRRYRMSAKDRIVFNGMDYKFSYETETGYFLQSLDNNGVIECITHTKFHEDLVWGKIVVHRDWYGEGEILARARLGETCLSTIDPNRRRRLHLRVEYCNRFLRMEASDPRISRSDASMEPAIALIYSTIGKEDRRREGNKKRSGKKTTREDEPCPSTLRDWLRAYEKGGFKAIALLDSLNNSGPKNRRWISAETLALCAKHAQRYASTNKPTKVSLYRDYVEDVRKANEARVLAGDKLIKTVSPKTFAREIARLGGHFIAAGRDGEVVARLKSAIVGRGLDVLWPGQRIEMDEWEVALMVLLVQAGDWEKMTAKERKAVERVRVWVTIAIDCATRCVLAAWLSIRNPSSVSAMACVEMTLVDKTAYAELCGAKTPWDMSVLGDEYLVDNATWLTGEAVTTAIAGIRSKHKSPPAGAPNLRARIEKLFGTFESHFIRFFTGGTFENVIKKGKYDAAGNASINVDELRKALIHYIVDVYHDTPHEGLAGETPRNAWLRLSKAEGVLPPPSRDIIRDFFGLELKRDISGSGIRIHGLHYQSVALQQMRTRYGATTVRVKLDRFNLQHISVWDGECWLKVGLEADDLNLQGVTYSCWVAAAESLRRYHADMAALSADTVRAAIRDIQQLAKMAVLRADLNPPELSEEEFLRIEERLFQSFDYGANAPFEGDIFDDESDTEFTQPAVQTEAASAVPQLTRATTTPVDTGSASLDDWMNDE